MDWRALAVTARLALATTAILCAVGLPLACWLAGFVLAVVFGAGAGSRILVTQGAAALLPLIAGAALLPSMALALGVWSGTSKPFEGILTAMWYIGPINRVVGIDYTGASNGAATTHGRSTGRHAPTVLINTERLLTTSATAHGLRVDRRCRARLDPSGPLAQSAELRTFNP